MILSLRHLMWGLLLAPFFQLAACKPKPQKLSTVEPGMSKGEVVATIGEPANKNIINKTEIWDYPDSNRTVVFRMDTVYTIITSPKARADSMGMWLDKTDDKIKNQLDNLADKVDSAGERIKKGLKKDSDDKK